MTDELILEKSDIKHFEFLYPKYKIIKKEDLKKLFADDLTFGTWTDFKNKYLPENDDK